MEYTIFLIPFLITLVGFWMYKYSPKKINLFIGYRTKKSMKNKKMWDYANKLCGKVWMILGTLMVIICAVTVILFNLNSIEFTETLLTIIILTQVLMLLISIFITENKLNSVNFEKNN